MRYSDKQHELEDILMRSVIKEDLDSIEDILSREDFDPSFSNSHILFYAIMYGKEKAAEIILKDNRIDPNGVDSEPIRYILYYIENYKKTNFVKLLLEDKRLDHDKAVNDITFYEVDDTRLLDLFYEHKAKIRNEKIDIFLEDS